MTRSTFTHGVLVAMAASALLAVGCSLVVSFDESQIPQDTDGGTDAEADSSVDTGIDTGSIDSGSIDSGEMDSTMTDSGADTTPGDTGIADSTTDAPVDSGVDSTAPVDSGTDSPVDSGTDTATDSGSDTAMDMDAMDMGVMDMGTDTSASTTPSTFAGCTSGDYAANDFTGDAGAAEITFPTGGLAYAPKCIRVKAGQTVTWTASGATFADHPLRHAPTNVDSTKIPDQDTGTTFSETFSVAGFYGYYCNIHGGPSGTGMSGTIQVVP